MKKTIFVTILAFGFLAAGWAVADMPQDACYNVASKIDEWIQKWAVVGYVYQYPRVDPCTGESVIGVFHEANNWTNRYARDVFPSGTIVGHTFQGYMGGKVTNYVMCADGRAKVGGRSFGWYGMGASQEVCDAM